MGSDVPGNEAINLVPVLCSAASGIQLPSAEWGLLLSASEEATPGSPPRPITLTSLLSEPAARSSEAARTSLLSPRLGSNRRCSRGGPGSAPAPAARPSRPSPPGRRAAPEAAAPAGPAPAPPSAGGSARPGPPPAARLARQSGVPAALPVRLPLLSEARSRSRRNYQVFERRAIS